MRSVLAVLSFICVSSFIVNAQTAAGVNVVGKFASIAEPVVTGAPFSGEALSESVQVLADGNRIVRKTTGKLYRSTDGRYRREGSANPGTALGTYLQFDSGIMILDPVAGFRFNLNPQLQTATQLELKKQLVLSVAGKPAVAATSANPQQTITLATVSEKELTPEQKAAFAKTAKDFQGSKITQTFSGTFPSAVAYNAGTTESLGTQNIEGIDAEGTRTTRTIEAGAIGNERPIEIVYEKWYSKDLQLVVMSKMSDPRFGEQTYRLTNISRSEPDASLFALPTEYKVVSDEANIYKLSRTNVEGQQVIKIIATEKAPAQKAKP